MQNQRAMADGEENFKAMPKQLALLLAAVLTVGLVTACSPVGGGILPEPEQLIVPEPVG